MHIYEVCIKKDARGALCKLYSNKLVAVCLYMDINVVYIQFLTRVQDEEKCKHLKFGCCINIDVMYECQFT